MKTNEDEIMYTVSTNDRWWYAFSAYCAKFPSDI